MRASRRAAVVLGAVLATLLGLAPAASAGPPPGGGALPGYTIVLPQLAPLAVDGGSTRVITGVDRHAGILARAISLLQCSVRTKVRLRSTSFADGRS